MYGKVVFLVLVVMLVMPVMSQPDPKNVSIVRPGTGNIGRVALVIGNAAYKDVSPLQNTINDAQDMRDTLRSLGFEVIYRENATEAEIRSGLSELARKSKNKEAVLYYSGHGVQLSGMNYLLPVDVDASEETVLTLSAIDLDRVLKAMSPATKRIVILDACRNNPYAKSIGREISKGLALVRQSPKETLIIYATDPDQIASDNPGERNGLFTKYLLKYMKEDGLKIEDCMKKVTKDVLVASNEKQKPWVHGSVISDFYFNPGKPEASQIELELELSQAGRTVSYQVIAQNLGVEGKVNIKLIFPVGLKDKNKEWPLQWKDQTFQAGENKKFTYREFEAATPGNFEVICRVEQNKKIIAEVKKQIKIDGSIFAEDADAARRRAELAALTEAKRKAEVEAQKQADLLAAERLKAELAEAKRKADEAEAQRWKAEAQRKADELAAQRLQAQLAEARRQADLQAEAERQAEKQRLALIEAQRQADIQRQAEARRQAEIRQREAEQMNNSYGLPSSVWSECRYEYQGEAMLDMTTDYWCRLSPSQQSQYAGQYQQGYAAAKNLALEKTIPLSNLPYGAKPMVLRLIPPGRFWMGSPDNESGRDSDEGPRHRVVISSAFYLAKYECTQAQWKAVMGKNPSYFPNAGQDAPVEQVSWNDVANGSSSFCGKTGLELPSEAAWEYASRAGTIGMSYAGDFTIKGQNNAPGLSSVAWYGGNSGVSYEGGYDSSSWSEKEQNHSRAGTHPVGQKSANGFGLYDTLGNVWEWCCDNPRTYSASDEINQLVGKNSSASFVGRGGSWSDNARLVRCANRNSNAPVHSNINLGFRSVSPVR